jgi:hypothetical protein
MKTPTEELQLLLERAAAHKMTPEELEAQRRSFAYGNAAIENPDITREMVDKAARQIEAETHKGAK